MIFERVSEMSSNLNQLVVLIDDRRAIFSAAHLSCILNLYHGKRRISLAEVEEIPASQKKTAK